MRKSIKKRFSLGASRGTPEGSFISERDARLKKNRTISAISFDPTGRWRGRAWQRQAKQTKTQLRLLL